MSAALESRLEVFNGEVDREGGRFLRPSWSVLHAQCYVEELDERALGVTSCRVLPVLFCAAAILEYEGIPVSFVTIVVLTLIGSGGMW
jgi:hypothetical protein